MSKRLNMRYQLAGLLMMCMLLGTQAQAVSLIPEHERRSVEQTYLTYPEWFLVHSPAEFAEHSKAHPAYEFPFLTHIGQLWCSYFAVTNKQLRENYPANLGYHAMILVIASSTSVEYALRSLYENTFGRASGLFGAGEMTEEEHVAAEIAQQYVDFVRREPWYLFDFSRALKCLWVETPVWGRHPLHKLERRYALSTEYVIKGLYAKLIEKATRAAYEPAQMTTWVVVSGLAKPDKLPAEIILKNDLGNGRAILVMSRYEAFGRQAMWLAQQGATFEDIAGNDGDILVTLLAPQDWTPPTTSSILFIQPIKTGFGQKRVALVLPVAGLTSALMEWSRLGLRVEHIYDY